MAQNERVGLKKFFNTSGQAYKNLELSKRFPEMSEESRSNFSRQTACLSKDPFWWGAIL
jgi:arsenate reductase